MVIDLTLSSDNHQCQVDDLRAAVIHFTRWANGHVKWKYSSFQGYQPWNEQPPNYRAIYEYLRFMRGP